MWLTAPVPSGSAEVALRYVMLPPIIRNGYVAEGCDAAALSEALPDAVVPTVSRLGDDSTVESGGAAAEG